jgi:hypothetical protein
MPVNIRLDWKWLVMTNTCFSINYCPFKITVINILVDYDKELNTAVLCFIVQAEAFCHFSNPSYKVKRKKRKDRK